MSKKKGLGRGLEHLIGNDFEMDNDQEMDIRNIALKEIKPNPYQPRKNFNEESLFELSESIKEQGVFQPILVRKTLIGYEIISGERRFRASKLAELEEIPAVVYDYDDEKMMEVALIENIQREDLTIVEEAKSYAMIIENLKITQEALGKKVGKSRPHITNTLRILQLSDNILDMLDTKLITMGHVKVLITIEDKKKVAQIVDKIINEGLSVREAENLAKNEKSINVIKKKIPSTKEIPRNKRLENSLREILDTKVKIHGQDKGTIEIGFASEEDLARILEQLKLV